MNGIVEKIFAQAAKIKFTGGLVGRVCSMVTLVLVAVAAGAGWGIKNDLILGGVLIVVGLIVVYAIKRIMDFAFTHPKIAMMDGAEIVQMEQLLASKHYPFGLPAPTPNVEGHVLELDSQDKAAVNVPEAPVSADEAGTAAAQLE